MKKVLFVFGTRPEAIKMAPLILLFRAQSNYDVKVCVTAQHRQMLDQVLDFFSIVPDFDLDLMSPNQTLSSLTAKILTSFQPILEELKPDYVFVQGDTTTVLAAALASFYNKFKVIHIEAGLRSNDMFSPFPEEMNRVLTGRIAAIHFAPTSLAVQNLADEHITENVFNVGNTVIDALLLGVANVNSKSDTYKKYFESLGVTLSKKIILVTCHRRENFGEPLKYICAALKTISQTYGDVEIVFPVHLNPNIKNYVSETLNQTNIKLIEPLDYPNLLWILDKSNIILTDSGGIQEEAPSLGKPVLVLREVTERVEGVEAGTAKLVGANYDLIVAEVNQLLTNEAYYNQMASAVNPYGNGDTANQILTILNKIQ